MTFVAVCTQPCRYPVVFIFSEGTGDWSPNFEIMIYGVLDILSKAVFGFILLLSHEGLDRITNFKRCTAPAFACSACLAQPASLAVPCCSFRRWRHERVRLCADMGHSVSEMVCTDGRVTNGVCGFVVGVDVLCVWLVESVNAGC